MIVYFVANLENSSELQDLTEINWKNCFWLSLDIETCIQQKKELLPSGILLKVDMNEEDVVNAVFSCMVGNSTKVRIKILELINETP